MAVDACFVNGTLMAEGKVIDPISWRAYEYAVRDATPEERKQLRDWLSRRVAAKARLQSDQPSDRNEQDDIPISPPSSSQDATRSSNFRRWQERDDMLRFAITGQELHTNTKNRRVFAITAAFGIFVALLAVLALRPPALFESEVGDVNNNSLRVPASEKFPAEIGVKVSGQIGEGRWPLKGIGEGVIRCQWYQSVPGSRNPITRRPLVLFEPPSGKLYAINGAAESAAAKGDITAVSLEEIRVGSIQVVTNWLDAGLALCEGDNAEAEKLVREANRMAALEPEFPEVWSGQEEPEGKRMYLELMQCLAEATRAAQNMDGTVDFNREAELDKACEAKTELTADERSLLIRVGIARSWPSQ